MGSLILFLYPRSSVSGSPLSRGLDLSESILWDHCSSYGCKNICGQSQRKWFSNIHNLVCNLRIYYVGTTCPILPNSWHDCIETVYVSRQKILTIVYSDILIIYMKSKYKRHSKNERNWFSCSSWNGFVPKVNKFSDQVL